MTLNDLDPAERRRLARSSGIGAALWVIILIFLALLPVTRKPFPKPDFPPVHLTLSSPVAAEAPVKQAAASQEPKPAAETPAPTAEKTAPAAAKPAPAATALKTAPAAPVKPATSKASTVKTAPSAPSAGAVTSAGLGIPDFDVPVTSSNAASGEAEFLDFSSSRQTQNPAQASVPSGGNTRAELEGSAAAVTTAKSSGATVSSKNASTGSPGKASAATAEALKGVEGAATSPVPASGSTGSSGATGPAAQYAETSTTSAGRVSSVAGLSFEGVPRTLLYPEDPRITLPDRLAKLVDSNRTVKIIFTVRKDGTVLGTTVTFTPLSALPGQIRDYLREEFATWRFEPGDQDGQASFAYSIKLE